MTPKEKRSAARSIVENPLFGQIMDDLESLAINGCVNAKLDDNESRAAYAAEIRVIRAFRQRLRFLAEENANEGRSAPV